MITYSPLPLHFSLKLKINIYKSRKIRYLDSNERDIILNTPDDSNGSANKIIGFTSDDVFSDDENIQVKDINFDNDNLVTKTVTNNNKCSLKFDSNSEFLDTGKVKSMILEKKIPDCSREQRNNIVNLNMDKVENCEFNLNSEDEFSFTDDKLNIELVEYENKENKITAECDTKNNNVKSIKCSINKEDKEEINNDYSFKDKLLLDSNNFITISSEEDKFKVLCEKKGQNKKKLIIIIIIVCAVVILIVILIATIIACKKDKKNEVDNNHLETSQVNNLEQLPKTIRTKRKNKTTMPKLETKNIEEKDTEDVMNINKRKKIRSKTRKSTKKRKGKKHKSTKITTTGNEE